MDPVAAIIQQQLASGAFMQQEEEIDYSGGSDVPDIMRVTKKNNVLPIWGNQTTMNLNTLVLENVKESYYYKNHLIEIDTFQPLIDEIFYQVKHLEPWEKGTRKVQGMTGMCGGVRGVGAGGVVSSAFCLLYRLFNVRVTRKQLISMLNSRQSQYIRGIGFMYVRYTQPPADLWYWFESYLDDEDEIDPRSGGGEVITFGQMVRTMLTKLDWYGTLFPRIPVPIQKDIDEKFTERKRLYMEEEMDYRSQRRGEDRDKDRDRDSKKREGSVPAAKPPDAKLPKVSRCKHHLRHHHCRKHRKTCPNKAKRLRKERDEAEKKLTLESEAKENGSAPMEN
ncbi:unnamed protein product [Caenorhabditis auriculariae]|uniref:Pre-mRNA-splicing factor 38 n=1 Tax=Caenorhabditis auriculariae TaxID=2777116 RepID=A0A8S1H3K9_9PELO|nr:unnamed protein product [Caenorhabditis auriculariae]